MAKRSKKTLVILQVGTGRETKHRGKDLKTALAVAVRSRVPKVCHVRWSKLHKLSTVAGGEGRISCPGEETPLNGQSVRYVAVRKRGRQLKSGTRRRKR